jgi:hypothetical protein
MMGKKCCHRSKSNLLHSSPFSRRFYGCMQGEWLETVTWNAHVYHRELCEGISEEIDINFERGRFLAAGENLIIPHRLSLCQGYFLVDNFSILCSSL